MESITKTRHHYRGKSAQLIYVCGLFMFSIGITTSLGVLVSLVGDLLGYHTIRVLNMVCVRLKIIIYIGSGGFLTNRISYLGIV